MIRQLLVIVSLLLCGATIVFWVRSLRVSDGISFLTHADTRYALATHPHGLDLVVETHFRSHPPTWNPVSPTPPAEGWEYSKFGYYDHNVGLFIDAPPIILWAPPAHYFAGLGYDTTTDNWSYPGGIQVFKRITHIDIPFWLIALVLTFSRIPALLGMSRRRKRMRCGRCIACGYDLRASHGACPECGRLAPGGSAPATQG